jgi:hypothetical protein
MKFTKFFVFICIGLFFGGITSTVGHVDDTNQTLGVSANDIEQYYLYYTDTEPIINGVIEDGEYPETLEMYSVDRIHFADLSWAHDNEFLYIGITTTSQGWVGFGQGENGMLGAEMFVFLGANFIGNNYIGHETNYVQPNLIDTQNVEGVILEQASTLENEVRTVEFKVPLSPEIEPHHDWEVGGSYGFFIAAHESSTAFLYHTYHTPRNLRVEILNDSIATPEQITISEFDFELIGDNVTLSANAGETNLQIEFSANTTFGYYFLGSALTDGFGDAQLTLSLSFFQSFVGNEILLYAIFRGSIGFSPAKSEVLIIDISDTGHDIREFYENRILDEFTGEFILDPDFFDNSQRLLGVIMLYMLVIIVTLLVYEYLKAVLYLVLIHREGAVAKGSDKKSSDSDKKQQTEES